MITYYLIGNWMGSFRTVDTTSTIKEFNEYIKKHNFIREEDKIYRNRKANGRIVITYLSDEGKKELNNPNIGA